jgi:hypothetical protein
MDAWEEVAFRQMKSARYRTKAEGGYDVDLLAADMFGVSSVGFRQIKQNVFNGLCVNLYGDHCTMWMRFANGKAVDKWFAWDRKGNLLLEVQFKEPYDFLKHEIPWKAKRNRATTDQRLH